MDNSVTLQFASLHLPQAPTLPLPAIAGVAAMSEWGVDVERRAVLMRDLHPQQVVLGEVLFSLKSLVYGSAQHHAWRRASVAQQKL